jgi:tRNA(Leu) C34 or U34 (ribose-2'-O)-methylase TrmL
MIKHKRGYAAIGLHSPKNVLNIGSVLRASTCYDVSLVVASGLRYRKAVTDTFKSSRHLPFIEHVNDLHDYVPYDCVPVAVEFIEEESQSLVDYVHPERAFYVFGPEDGTLGEKTLSWCRDVVYVPTHRCMNLAATVNVVLYDRMSKQINKR